MVGFSSMRSAAIGFLGLGNMGKHMATNLLAANESVTLFDANSTAYDHFNGQKQVNIAFKPEDAVKRSDFIILMLPNGTIARDVCQSNIFPVAKKETCIIDCSTIDIRTSKEMYRLAREHQLHFVDAPVSGGVIGAQNGTLTFMVGAQNGTLTFMVGAESNDFHLVEGILAKMGKSVVHVGPNGSGLSAKICNNLLAAISMIGTAEAMHLGTKLGLDKTILAKLINSSTGQCWSSESYNPCPGIIPNVPSNNDYNGGFACELMTKDLLFALDAAKDSQTIVPLTEQATTIYRSICSTGLKKKDFSIVYQYLTDLRK